MMGKGELGKEVEDFLNKMSEKLSDGGEADITDSMIKAIYQISSMATAMYLSTLRNGADKEFATHISIAFISQILGATNTGNVKQ